MKRQQQRIEWRQNQTPKVDAEMTIDPCRQRFVHSLGDRTHSSASDPGPPGTSEMGRGSSQVAQIIPDPRLVRQCKMRTGPEVNHCCYVLVLQFLEDLGSTDPQSLSDVSTNLLAPASPRCTQCLVHVGEGCLFADTAIANRDQLI